MNKLYSVHDHWTDINKKNDVDIESIDGVITGIKVNGEDYGGSITWESVYSGSIDPEGEVRPFTADISLTMTAADTIKVIYDNTEYVLSKQVFNENIYYGAEPASLPADIDFSNCPFLIQVLPDTVRVYTETAGLHTLEISVAQSGGGESDFSTANVTFKPRLSSNYQVVVPYFDDPNGLSLKAEVYSAGEPFTLQVPIYKDGATLLLCNVKVPVTGNIEAGGDIDLFGKKVYEFYITGNCTVGNNQ